MAILKKDLHAVKRDIVALGKRLEKLIKAHEPIPKAKKVTKKKAVKKTKTVKKAPAKKAPAKKNIGQKISRQESTGQKKSHPGNRHR